MRTELAIAWGQVKAAIAVLDQAKAILDELHAVKGIPKDEHEFIVDYIHAASISAVGALAAIKASRVGNVAERAA